MLTTKENSLCDLNEEIFLLFLICSVLKYLHHCNSFIWINFFPISLVQNKRKWTSGVPLLQWKRVCSQEPSSALSRTLPLGFHGSCVCVCILGQGWICNAIKNFLLKCLSIHILNIGIIPSPNITGCWMSHFLWQKKQARNIFLLSAVKKIETSKNMDH